MKCSRSVKHKHDYQEEINIFVHKTVYFGRKGYNCNDTAKLKIFASEESDPGASATDIFKTDNT